MKKATFSQKQIQEIINYYLAPHSLNDTTKFAGLTKSAIIRDLLISQGIPLHDKTECRRLQWKKQQAFFQEFKNRRTFADMVLDQELKNNIIEDYCKNNLQFKDLLQKYDLSYAMLGRLLKAWQIKKEKSKQVSNLIKNKYKKYQTDKNSLQAYFDNHRIVDCAEHFSMPVRFLEKLIREYNIDWTLHNKNINGCGNSVPENRYYEYLIGQYGKDDVLRQYDKDPRYPFKCDFYVRSKDLFIELNYHWSHGDHPFDPADEEDIAKLNLWKSRVEGHHSYADAIRVWTITDPLKLQCFKENNMNYQILYLKGNVVSNND